tara:strand:- start:15649 stop:19371 length:3723 start_codon:yes stop_codon:yes gene_type:complete
MNRVSGFTFRQRTGQLLLLVLLTAVFLLSEALAASQVRVSASEKGSSGQILFDWGRTQEFSTEIEEGYLYIRFAEPFEADLQPASQVLGHLIGRGEVMEGNQSVRFPLKGEVSLSSRRQGDMIIVELNKLRASEKENGKSDKADAVKENAAAIPVTLRIGDHKGFSRLVFDWPDANTPYQSRVKDDRLEITFDARARINLTPINDDPLAFARSAVLEAMGDKTRISIALAPGSEASDFRNDNSIVFDVRKSAGGKIQEKSEPKPKAETVTEKTEPVSVPPAQAAVTSTSAPETKAEAGISDGAVEEGKKSLPAIELPAVRTARKSPAAAPARLENNQHDSDVTLDTPRVAEASPPTNILTGANATVSDTQRPREAHGFEMMSQLSSSAIAPIGPTIVLDPPKEQAATPVAEPPRETSAETAPQESGPIMTLAPIMLTPKTEKITEGPNMTVRIANLKDGFRLIFPWQEPAAMAMFEVNDAYWVVFDRPAQLDFSNLSGPYKFLVPSARQLDQAGGTLLRFDFREGYAPKVTRRGNEWHADFTVDAKPAVAHPLGVQTEGISASRFRAFIPAVNSAGEFRFTDPGSGEEIIALPLADSGQGIQEARVFNSISILPTVQGIALISAATDVRIGHEMNGVAVTAVSSDFARPQEPKEVARKPGEEIYPTPVIQQARVVRLDEWRQVSPVLFTKRRQELQQALANASKEDRRQAQEELARFFVAQKYYAEGLGVLAEMQRRYPAIEKDREFRLLNGLAELGMHHYESAGKYLFDRDFDGDVEVAPFRGMIAAGQGNWERAAQELNYAAPAFEVQGREWADHFHLLQARAALENVDVNLAREVLAQMKSPTAISQQADKAYLEGLHAMQLSDYPTAAAKFDEAIRAGYRPISEQARFQKVNVALMSKTITPEQAIDALERLDFAWRGDNLEIELQKRLGDLYVATGEIDNGLETYKRIVRYFPESPYARDLGRKMNDLFAELFLEGGADKMPPVKALAIYYQYRELTPVGERGDRMIQTLADRLTRVDLLEQAAQLLEHQVNFRLKGEDKAHAGTKLAIVQLWNGKPDAALRALYDTRWRLLSPEEKRERLYLEAQAQTGLENYGEALALINHDNSVDADELRAEIYWKSRDWAKAIPAIEKMIGTGGGVGADPDRLDRQRIMQIAVALNLADDKPGLMRLRQRYNDKMAGSPDQAAFDLITEQKNPNETDFRQRATLIAQVGQLENFMTGYREKLENGEFWATY